MCVCVRVSVCVCVCVCVCQRVCVCVLLVLNKAERGTPRRHVQIDTSFELSVLRRKPSEVEKTNEASDEEI